MASGTEHHEGFFPKRHVLFFLQALGIAIAYALRVCVSTAAQKVKIGSDEQTMYTEFNWTNAQQSAMLGAFFYGYMVTQIPGSWLTAKLGPTRVFGHGVLWASVLTIATPIASSSFLACMFMRVATGLVEGVTYPAMSQQVRNWAPESERSSVISFIFAGAFIGTAGGLPLSSMLLTSFGWRSIFYVTGALGCLWSLMWFYLAADTPATHGRVHPRELALIGEPPCSQTPLSPLQCLWLLRHRQVRAICAASWAYCWAYYMVMTELPSYLATVLDFSVQTGGFLGVLPFLFVAVTTNLGGIVVDWANSKNVDMCFARRATYVTSAIGTCVCLLSAAYLHIVGIVFALIVVGTGFVGLSVPAYAPNIIETGGSQASSVFGVVNTFASIPGFVAPQLAGLLTDSLGNAAGFRVLFWISCAIYALAATIFVFGVSVETIPEGAPQKTEP